MNTNIVAVNIKTYSIYDFLHDGETEKDLLERAIKAKQDDINTWEKNCETYPDVEQYKIYLKQAKEKEYKIMTWDEFEQGLRKYLLSDGPAEITEDEYNEMLNVLPPLNWCTKNGVEMFCMSEMYTGSYTTQYAKHNGKYYRKMVDYLDESTWIYHLLK